MFRHIKLLLKISVLACVIVITGSCVSTSPKLGADRPAAWAVSVEKDGLDNFYKVDNNLYRGEQPTQAGIIQLKSMGVKTIVNLRADHSDKAEIGNINIGYEEIPMEAWGPKDENVVKFLKIATDKGRTPVFIHCKRGADRTGFMVASYRIAVQDWSKEDAIEEMTRGGYRFHPIWKNLVNYIEKLDVDKIRKEAGIVKFTAKQPEVTIAK